LKNQGITLIRNNT